jgi:hypothetical protein
VARTTFTRTTRDGKAVTETGVKFCRLLTRTIRGHEQAFVQLVLRGVPLQKPKNHVQDGLVGLDLGPSQVAVVGEGFVKTIPFCPDLDRTETARRRYLRKLDRQRRANNPGNYRPNGTVKPRSQRKPWRTPRWASPLALPPRRARAMGFWPGRWIPLKAPALFSSPE